MNESEMCVDISDELRQESPIGQVFVRMLLAEIPGAISEKEYSQYIKHVQSKKLRDIIEKKHSTKSYQQPTDEQIPNIALLSVFHRVVRYFKDSDSIQKHFSNIKPHDVPTQFLGYLSKLIPKTAQEELVVNLCKATLSRNQLSLNDVFELGTRLAIVI